MIVAVFEWDNYCTTITYPKNVRGLTHEGKRPSSLKILIKEARAYDTKVSDWFNECYSALAKI